MVSGPELSAEQPTRDEAADATGAPIAIATNEAQKTLARDSAIILDPIVDSFQMK